MNVYIDRNNIHVELIRFRRNSDFIAVGTFEVENFRDRCVYEIGAIAIREMSPAFGEEPWWTCTRNARGRGQARAFVYLLFQLTKKADSYMNTESLRLRLSRSTRE